MAQPNHIRDNILAWYARHGRRLPWRETRNPYFIWVSEIMLQQTQVATVIPYYHYFLQKFPNIQGLARAPLQEVLKAWENLGYYSRARYLHEAARKIVRHLGGRIPDTRKELLSLPGVGPYTAAAILSIAYGQRIPAVDGNVRRIVSRLYLIREAVDKTETLGKIHTRVAKLVPGHHPGRFNQALMDLGALICTPRSPACEDCPLEKLCMARRQKMEERLPLRKRRGPLSYKEGTAALISDPQGRLLIVQRPGQGLLGGLWKFPGGLLEKKEDLAQALRKTVMAEIGIKVRVKDPLISVSHTYTHFKITLHAFRCKLVGGDPRPLTCQAWTWAVEADLETLPFSRVDRKVMDALSFIR